ncbi:hypothetical protein Tco_0573356 [Tanacetum coccineum]
MHFLLSSMSVVYVLTTPIPEDGGDDATLEQIMKRAKWDNDDYVCIDLILNGMSDSLFDIYQNVKSSKELWDSLEAKYMAEDASSKKFLVSNFTNYKMIDSRPVLEQYNELLGILGRFTQHKMNMDEAIQCPFPGFNTMADVNVNAPAEQAPAMAPPTRTDEQILPRSRWVPVGKSNCYLDVERSQSNPIYKISVDILKHTNFFRAFIASSTIPSIYIQQLRDALQITPVDNNNAFSSPPTPDVLINFVNELGYPNVVRTLSTVVTNDMFQPWTALTTIINLCLTGKTSGFKRPRALVLQIL